MKKLFIAMCVCFCASCTSDEPESAIINGNMNSDSTEMKSVTIHFAQQYDIRPMTRAAIGDVASRLDVWIYEGDTELTAVHQSSSDVGFGSVSLSLNKTKTYTLYALAHKATAACTLADGIISFPDDKPKESFFYTTTFSPATTTSINAEMSRICGKFTMTTTDAVPDDVDHVRFTIINTGLRYNVITKEPANLTDRTVDFPNITRKADGTCSFSFNILASDAVADFEITATAYASDNSVIETKTFANVPIRNNYRTTYSGYFFTTEGMTMTFTVDDWLDYDTVIF